MILKTQMLRVHRYCGLFACVLIGVQALTGVIEVYQHDIAQLVDPSGMVRQASNAEVPVDQVLQALQTQYPDRRVERIVFPDEPSRTYFVHLLDTAGHKEYASIDPGSAEILRSGDIWTFPAEAAARIHYDYTIGRPGMAIVALTGILGLVMAMTGFIYWRPRPGKWANQLRVNWRLPGKAILRQLHRSVGVVMALLLIFSLGTGVVLAIYYFDAAAGAPGTVHTAAPRSDGPDIDTVIQQARAKYPEHFIRDVRFSGSNLANVYFHAPEHSPRAAHQVSVSLEDGSILAIQDAEENKALWVTWLPLHSGESFGVLGKVLVTTNALVLFGLAASGPLIWLFRVRPKRRKKRVQRNATQALGSGD